MLKKDLLLYFCLVFFSLFLSLALNNSKAEEYLDTVINKLNKMEKDLQILQKEKNISDGFANPERSNNTIASHEKRLIDLEDDLRNINGRIDEVLFELKTLANELNSLKVKDSLIGDNNEEKSLVTLEEESSTQTVTSQDPNMEDNPSMKVLGVIKENKEDLKNLEESDSSSTNTRIIPSVSEEIKKDSITSKQLENLSKNPSDIYKYAYNMLIQENFLEAEKYFNIFLGENPDDPLASNAYYWLGETFYVQKSFQKAAISFAKGYQKFPKGNKAIDQLFKLALTFINLGKNEDACASFSKLELEFPNASERIKNRAKEYKTRVKC